MIKKMKAFGKFKQWKIDCQILALKHRVLLYNSFWRKPEKFSMIPLLARQLWERALASTCMVLRQIAFKKQLIQLSYPVLMLEIEVKWWSLLSTLIIYCYCLQRLQWRRQGGAHWGTCPTNLVLCPTKMFLSRFQR